jgi:hypothetical protein
VNLFLKAKFLSLMTILLLSVGILGACSGSGTAATPGRTPTAAQATPTPQPSPNGDDWVEVVYFHRTNRCSSCLRAEEITRYTIDTYFQNELASGELVFRVLDVQAKANGDVVDRYEAYGSCLFVNDVEDGTDHIVEVTDIWFLLGDEEEFVSLVKGEIEKRLG